jgi:hypothetical protein
MVPENKQNRRYKQINFIGLQNNRHPPLDIYTLRHILHNHTHINVTQQDTQKKAP